jgi:uncharacterized cupin superfamily protein
VVKEAQMINEADISWDQSTHGERFAHKRKQLGRAAGGRAIGCSLYEIPPGKRPFPYHFHTANEEAMFVLAGTAMLRLDGRELRVRAGDYVAFPVGPAGAHQVVNDSGETVRILMISTMIEPEVSVYPDSDKIGVFAGSPPGGDPTVRSVFTFLPQGAKVDYWYEEK